MYLFHTGAFAEGSHMHHLQLDRLAAFIQAIVCCLVFLKHEKHLPFLLLQSEMHQFVFYLCESPIAFVSFGKILFNSVEY